MDNYAARRYINSIRNKVKQTYAEQYWAWILKRLVYNYRSDEPSRGSLGVMAAQSVRLQLYGFMHPNDREKLFAAQLDAASCVE